MPIANNEFIRISNLSQMGSCETRFVDAVKGKLFATKAMQVGAKMHDNLAKKQPQLNQDQIVEKIKNGEEFWATEMPIRDYVFMLTGRIDSLHVSANPNGGKSDCVVIDHKYPRNPYRSIPTYYSIQLVAYANAIEHSNVYGNICNVVGTELVSREKETHDVTSSVKMEQEELECGKSHMKELVDRAWNLNKEIAKPIHKRFDICNGKWIDCYCRND